MADLSTAGTEPRQNLHRNSMLNILTYLIVSSGLLLSERLKIRLPELEEAIPDGDGEVVAGPVVALPQQQTVVLGAG